MKTKQGYVIVRKRKSQEIPIAVARAVDSNNIYLTGYIYIYPTRNCAEMDIAKLKAHGWSEKYEIRRVNVEEQ